MWIFSYPVRTVQHPLPLFIQFVSICLESYYQWWWFVSWKKMALNYLISIWKSVFFEAEMGETQRHEAIWAAPVKGLPSCWYPKEHNTKCCDKQDIRCGTSQPQSGDWVLRCWEWRKRKVTCAHLHTPTHTHLDLSHPPHPQLRTWDCSSATTKESKCFWLPAWTPQGLGNRSWILASHVCKE